MAAITLAFNLQAKFVIHTVGPVWKDGKHEERELLSNCYSNSLQLAADNGCTSIAFPLISAGVYGCPVEIAIAAATQAIREFLHDHEMEVYLGDEAPVAKAISLPSKKKRSLEDLLAEVDDTFSEALLSLIDVKGKTDPEVYKKANSL